MAGKLPFAGSKLEMDPTGGSSYTVVADLYSISPHMKKRGYAETTVADSPTLYREYIPCYKDGGEPKVKARFGKTSYAALESAFENDTLIPSFRFSFPLLAGESTPSRFTYLAIIAEIGIPEKGTDGEDIWEIEVTLRIVGKPTFISGT